jgi:nucleotide-binding universal stress UspA family protein
MTVKSILALSVDADTDESTLACATIIARRFRGHITVAHIKGLSELKIVSGVDAGSGLLSASFMGDLEARAESRESEARDAFENFAQREALAHRTVPGETDQASASWTVREGDVASLVAEYGGSYDLIVVGRPRDGVTPTSRALIESALFTTGRPVLIAPPDPPATLGGTVLIGWNRSAPAARAFHAAKSLLLDEAKKVRIMSVQTGAKSGPSADDIAANLAWNGYSAEVREIAPDYRSVGEVVMAEAGAIGADLVVLGAYSHSRIRRLVLGGVTTPVIAHTTLPVFMAL